MSKIFVTSDLHFGHTNVIKHENRPWDTVEEMNQGLIDNWNKVVSDEDTVYVLGDVTMGGYNIVKDILPQLKGHKILVRGNHDSKMVKDVHVNDHFEEIVSYKSLRHNKKHIVMFHHPICCWDGELRESIHLYGHIHSNSHELPAGFNRKQSYNVGVDVNHYTPVELDWILNLMEMRKEPEKYVPKNTCYCYEYLGRVSSRVDASAYYVKSCPFWDTLDNKSEQEDGYCHLLGKGDAELGFGLLWDQCKECNINDWEPAMKPWKCDNCNADIMVFEDYQPTMCCSGLSNQCGCMGMPIDPMFCDECEVKIYGKSNEKLS